MDSPAEGKRRCLEGDKKKIRKYRVTGQKGPAFGIRKIIPGDWTGRASIRRVPKVIGCPASEVLSTGAHLIQVKL